MYHLTSKILFQKDSSYKYQLCTNVYKGDYRQIIRIKYLMCQVPTEVLKCHATPNLS